MIYRGSQYVTTQYMTCYLVLCIKITCFKDDMINQWSITELQGRPDLTRTMATGHFNSPHNWVLSVEHTQTLAVRQWPKHFAVGCKCFLDNLDPRRHH